MDRYRRLDGLFGECIDSWELYSEFKNCITVCKAVTDKEQFGQCACHSECSIDGKLPDLADDKYDSEPSIRDTDAKGVCIGGRMEYQLVGDNRKFYFGKYNNEHQHENRSGEL